MKVHRGKQVEKAVRESGISLTSLALKLKVSRRTLYNYFQQSDLSVETIVEIGKAIHNDFTHLFPASSYKVNVIKSEADEDSVMYWKTKYVELLEKFNDMLLQQQREGK
jgi:predicted transcriptional regulator